MVNIVARMGPDDTDTWREILIDLDALEHAAGVSLDEARAIHRRRAEFIRRMYEIHGLEPGREYDFCPYTGAILSDGG